MDGGHDVGPQLACCVCVPVCCDVMALPLASSHSALADLRVHLLRPQGTGVDQTIRRRVGKASTVTG